MLVISKRMMGIRVMGISIRMMGIRVMGIRKRRLVMVRTRKRAVRVMYIAINK